MKPTYLILLFIFLCACSDDLKEIEVLKEKLPTGKQGLEKALTQSKDETEKLLIYNELFKAHMRNQPKEAQSYLEQMGQLAKQAKNNHFLAKYHYGMGYMDLRHTKDYHSALNKFLDAKECYEGLGEFYSVGKTLNNIGYIFFHTEDYDFAIKYYEEAIKYYENKIPALIRLNLNMGLSYRLKSNPDFEKALQHFNTSITLNAKSNFKQNYYYQRLYIQKGDLMHEIGEYENSILEYKKSLTFFDDQDNKSIEQVISTYSSIAEALISVSKFGKAKGWLSKAKTLIDQKPIDRSLITEYHNVEGSFHLAQGKYEEAEAILIKGVEAVGNEVINNEALKKSMQLLGQCQSALMAKGREDMEASTTRRLYLLQQGQTELQADFDKKVKRDALRHTVRLHDARNHAQLLNQRMARLIVLATIFGLLALIFFYGFYQHRKKVVGVRRILKEGWKGTEQAPPARAHGP